MTYPGFYTRKRPGQKVHRVSTFRTYRFDTLEIGDELELRMPRDKWKSARRSAYQYGQRAGKKFQTRTGWNDQHHRVLVVERVG